MWSLSSLCSIGGSRKHSGGFQLVSRGRCFLGCTDLSVLVLASLDAYKNMSGELSRPSKLRFPCDATRSRLFYSPNGSNEVLPDVSDRGNNSWKRTHQDASRCQGDPEMFILTACGKVVG